MFAEKPCMAQALCDPGDYLPEDLHTAAFSNTTRCLHAPPLNSPYLCSLLCSSSNSPVDLNTSSLDFYQIHFSQESKMWSNSK